MHNKIKIITDENIEVEAQAPIIISASRSTDIPTFYSEWFKNRWEKGYIKWINPFNQKPIYVSFENTRLVVFWTKNPKPMMKEEYMRFLKSEVQNFYFQFTLNDYDNECYEENIQSLKDRIKIFKDLSNMIGKEKVIWRFDPLILTDKIDIKELLRRIENIANELYQYTEKLVFSFADISIYRKVQNNLKNIDYIEFQKDTMEEFAAGLQQLNKKWDLEISTCSEEIDLDKFDIYHNKCIDDELIIKLFKNDKKLMDFIGYDDKELCLIEDNSLDKLLKQAENEEFNLAEEYKKINESVKERTKANIKTKVKKDKGQRKECGCIVSKDIGQYNTCPHGCIYCYANTSNKRAIKNYKLSRNNQLRETILP